MVKLAKLTDFSTTLMLDSGSDCASSRGQLVHKKTKVKRTSIFSSTEFLIREHFNNFHIFSNNIYQTVSPQPLCPKSVSVKAFAPRKGQWLTSGWCRNQEHTLISWATEIPALGEESAPSYNKRKCLKYCLLGFVGKRNLPSKLLEWNDWELSRR